MKREEEETEQKRSITSRKRKVVKRASLTTNEEPKQVKLLVQYKKELIVSTQWTNDKVSHLKESIAQITKISPNHLRLSMEGKDNGELINMKSESTISKYTTSNWCRIHCEVQTSSEKTETKKAHTVSSSSKRKHSNHSAEEPDAKKRRLSDISIDLDEQQTLIDDVIDAIKIPKNDHHHHNHNTAHNGDHTSPEKKVDTNGKITSSSRSSSGSTS